MPVKHGFWKKPQKTSLWYLKGKCEEGFLVLQKKKMLHGESKQTMN
jgi:hypothetical protein